MKTNKFWLNWLIVFAVILSNISLSQTAYAENGKDIRYLLNPSIIALQEKTKGEEVEVGDEDNPIDAEKLVKFRLEFKVPTKNDKPKPSGNNYVEYNDFADIEIGEGFNLTSDSEILKPIKIVNTDDKIGSYKFIKEDNKLKLRVKFDAYDKEIFSGNDINDITVRASGSFEIDKSGIGKDGKNITILGKIFKIIVPEDIKLSKTGEVNKKNHTILWTVNINGKRGNQDIDFENYVFYDDISSVGEYFPNSFKVNDIPKNDIQINLGKLTYTFPENSIGEQKITFETKFTPIEFRGDNDGNKTNNIKTPVVKTNTAQLKGSINGKSKADDTAKVEWKPEFARKTPIPIEKGKNTYHYEVSGKTRIDWQIEINQEKASLKNVIIKDKLQKEEPFRIPLDFVSAKLEILNDAGEVEETRQVVPTSTDSTFHNFEIGDLNQTARLIIVSEVNGTLSQYLVNRFSNTAYVGWDGLSYNDSSKLNEYITVSSRVVIGKGGITKEGPSDENSPYYQPIYKGSYDSSTYASNEIEWHVRLTNGDSSLRALDLMIFDKSVDATNWKKGQFVLDDNGQANVSPEILNSLTKGLDSLRYLKYVDGSLQADGLQGHVYKVKLKGTDKYVADLLVVNGFTPSNKTFNFKTKMVGAINLVHNNTDEKNAALVFNRVYLESNNKLIDYSDRWLRYRSKMIDKRVVSAENAEKFYKNTSNSENVNSDINPSIDIGKTDTEKEKLKKIAFNHKDKSILYRLSINAANNITDSSKDDNLGGLTITDELPEGWEFVELDNQKPYVIFDGTAVKNKTNDGEHLDSTDARVIAKNKIDLSSLATYKLENNNRKITFNFNKMNGPYVVLLKAQLTDKDKSLENATQDKYTISNTATIIADRKEYTHNNYSATSSQDVEIKNKVLKKEIDRSDASNGILKWNIEYRPYDFVERKDKNVALHLEDVLSKGIELVNENGKPKVKIEETTIAPNGTIESSNVINSDGLVEYNKSERTLTLKIQDENKSYRFSYETNIFADKPVKVKNEVKLLGSNIPNETNTIKDYNVSDSEASASLNRNPWLKIKKIDDKSKKSLEGAEFTLKTKDDKIVEVGITDKDGEILFSGLEEGKYDLIETRAPNGYYLDPTQNYEVVVDKTKKQLVSISGGNNVITITNTKDIPQVSTEGILRVKKIVTGNQGELDRAFNFTFNLMNLPQGSPDLSYDYKITDDSNNVISSDKISKNNKTFRLKHNQTIEIKGLPVGARYKIDEDDYINDGYEKSSLREEGKISSDTDTVVFTNKKHILPQVTTNTSLTISKEIQGNLARNEDKFQFKIYFDTDASKQYKYTIDNDTNKHNIKNEDEFELSGGQSITIEDVEIGNIFRIKEVNTLGYTPNSEEISVITTTAPELNIVKFVNTKEKQIKYGSLKITKTIQGNLADITKKFKFIVKIGQDINKYYDYEGLGAIENGKIKSGDEIWLSNGQGIVIKDIIVGTDYEIKENNEDYVKNVSGDKGTIVLGENIANFINTKNSTGGGGPSGGNPPTPDKKEEPKKPEEPKKSEEPKKPQEPEKPKETETTVNPNEEPKKEPIPEIPTSDTKPPTDVPFIPTKITGKIPENKNPILTIVDENGVPIGKAQVNIKDGTYVFIDDDRVPEGTAKIHNDNTLEILEDEIPKSTTNKILSKRTLPKTGSQKEYYYIIGLILIGIGIFIRKRK